MITKIDNLCQCTLTRGSTPGPNWGRYPQTLVIGLHSTLIMSPHFYDKFYAYGFRESKGNSGQQCKELVAMCHKTVIHHILYAVL